MKFLILAVLITGHTYAAKLAPDWVQEGARIDATAEVSENFKTILEAQGKALDQLSSKKSLPFGFQLNEMVTDIGVTKSGLLGIAALAAQAGVEIKWKRVTGRKLSDEEVTPADILVPETVTESELAPMADSIVSIVKASGKVRDRNLRGQVLEALQTVHSQLNDIKVTSFQRWKLRHLRLDLNFSASGSLWFVARAGTALRIRMEWRLKQNPFKSELARAGQNSQFVTKVLGELNEALTKVQLKGFRPAKVFIGVGASHRGGFLGLWRYRAGFVGWLGFVPVPVQNLKSLRPASLPLDLLNSEFTIGGEDEEKLTENKLRWPFRRRSLSRQSFAKGLTKSLETAAFFAREGLKDRSTHWRLSEIKTTNQIGLTGFFGLADVTTQGNLEIDFKRN